MVRGAILAAWHDDTHVDPSQALLLHGVPRRGSRHGVLGSFFGSVPHDQIGSTPTSFAKDDNKEPPFGGLTWEGGESKIKKLPSKITKAELMADPMFAQMSAKPTPALPPAPRTLEEIAKDFERRQGFPRSAEAPEFDVNQLPYCCKPVETTADKFPCSAYGVDRFCMAKMLDQPQFDSDAKIQAAEFLHGAHHGGYCCKREAACLGHGIQVTNQEIQATPESWPISTADLIENHEKDNFVQDPDMHGCMDKLADRPDQSLFPATGINFKKSVDAASGNPDFGPVHEELYTDG